MEWNLDVEQHPVACRLGPWAHPHFWLWGSHSEWDAEVPTGSPKCKKKGGRLPRGGAGFLKSTQHVTEE